MLFDLRGRRRRAVQVTYVALALLMGGGLVFFGIGGSVGGGLLDAFTGNNSSSTSDVNKPVQKRIDAANKTLAANPKDVPALVQLVRGHYTLATADTDRQTGAFGKDGKGQLGKASDAWKRYLATKPAKVNPDLAVLMLTAYSPTALNQPANGTEAAEIVAEARNNSSAYLQLVQYATLAGQKRKADLAGQRALELAPKSDRSAVKQALAQAKAATAQRGGSTSTPNGGGG